MNKLTVKYSTNEIVVLDGTTRLASHSGSDADFDKFKEWIDSYNHAVKQYANREHLLEIGRELFSWLNLGQNWLVKYLKNPQRPLMIEFQIPVKSSQAQKAFIEAPWELLADKTGHLAKDPDLTFCPIRRIGKESDEKRAASKYKLNTVFMAASPRHVKPELAYEQEESSMLSLNSEKATNMDLFVEESGNLSQLTALINELQPVDVVHLSCHGNIDSSNPDNSEPYLCLETITGELDKVTGDGFEQKYSQNRPALLFLSACKTSEAHTNKESSEKKEYSTFTQTLIKRGFPAVLGWSGSVSDSEATRFAGELYRNLSQTATVEDAVTKARYSLFIPPKESQSHMNQRTGTLHGFILGQRGVVFSQKGIMNGLIMAKTPV